MRTLLFIGVLLMASCSESQVKEDAGKSGYRIVTALEFKEMLSESDIQIVDVRKAVEFSQGTIQGAVNIDVLSSDFRTKISELDKSKKTLIFCKSGGRSGRAGAMMDEMGFETIVDLSGGYSGWPRK